LCKGQVSSSLPYVTLLILWQYVSQYETENSKVAVVFCKIS